MNRGFSPWVIPSSCTPRIVISTEAKRSGEICFSTSPDPISGIPKNKVEKSGMFLAPEKMTSKHHVSPHIPPRSYHQKTTLNHRDFPKHPSKTP